MSQYAKFLSRIIENLPDMDKQTMQSWIEDPGRLRQYLSKLATPGWKWCDSSEAIHLSVTSDGTTGADWIKRLEGSSHRVTFEAQQLLHSYFGFKVSKGRTIKIKILKGSLWSKSERNSGRIHTDAAMRDLFVPNAEVACLIREKFTNLEISKMGLFDIVVMHNPITNLGGNPRLLKVSRSSVGLEACNADPAHQWDDDVGFAFVASVA